MDPFFFVGALRKGFKAIMLLITCWPIIDVILTCCGILFIYNYAREWIETSVWYLYWYLCGMWYDMNSDVYFPDGMANFTNYTMFGPTSNSSSQFVRHFLDSQLTLIYVGPTLLMLMSVALLVSVYLNVIQYRRSKQKESPPKPENADWQGVWTGLGKILEAWGPAMSWDFTLEHRWDPEKLSQYLSQGQCGLHKSKEAQLIWGLACAYRTLYNTVLERESFRAEVQAKGKNSQVKSDQLQETPVTITVALVEGKKWKRVSTRLEWKKEEEEEVEEDPGEGPSSEPPPRKAKGKTKRHEEESDEEEISITTRRPLKMTEIQGSRKEFTRHPSETLVSWLVCCWDAGASSLSLDHNEARQLGAIARDPAVDRGISRCLDGAATLWERMLIAARERYPFKDGLKPMTRRWDTVEKGIQYLREMAVVEMLYDPNFVPNDPHQDHDKRLLSQDFRNTEEFKN